MLFFDLGCKTQIQGFGKSAGEFAIRYYAKNLQARGINANSIVPGIVNTEAYDGYVKKVGHKLGNQNYKLEFFH